MKKKFIFALVLVGCFLTACSSEIPLEDSNTEVVAEYVAELLLRYGSDKPDKLMYVEPTLKVTATPSVEVTPTPEVTPTKAASKTAAPNKSTAKPNKTGDKKESLVANTTSVALNDIYGYKGVTISVKGGKEYTSYPENASAYCVTANEGCKLYIVTLSAKNENEKTVNFDLEKKGVTYYLYVNGKWYKSLATILDNDAQFLKAKLSKGKSSEFLIAFEIDKKLSSKDIELITIQGTNSCEIDLK